MRVRPPAFSSPQLLALLALGVACDRPEPQFAFVDQPSPPPPEVEVSEPAKVALDDEREPDDADRCTRGSGRGADGECRRLSTRDAGYVERVALPRGRFVMGDVPLSYDASAGREDARPRWSGQPPRTTEVEAFWIDLHEVTREAYEGCVAAGNCKPAICPDGRDALEASPTDLPHLMPQTCVTHGQARRFCEAHGGRLPTQREWEYAARGVDARPYPWGSQINDQLLRGLGPVTDPKVDVSYFGLFGMGVNAMEWVAEAYEVDASLAPFLERPFRRPKGPHARATAKDPAMHVIKGGRAGAVRAAAGADVLVGFRCAADLSAEDEALTVPAEPPNVPNVQSVGGLWVFGGVAEVVDRSEAEAFCQALRVEEDGRVFDTWRLPTREEITVVSSYFRGPGPFWGADGAFVQKGPPGSRQVRPTDPWVEEAADAGEPLAARCVHDELPG